VHKARMKDLALRYCTTRAQLTHLDFVNHQMILGRAEEMQAITPSLILSHSRSGYKTTSRPPLK
jgi:hypothetical protein